MPIHVISKDIKYQGSFISRMTEASWAIQQCQDSGEPGLLRLIDPPPSACCTRLLSPRPRRIRIPALKRRGSGGSKQGPPL